MALAVKDKETVVFAQDNQVYILDCATGSIASTIDAPSASISSLSISEDRSLLLIASATGCAVHNLSNGARDSFHLLSDAGVVACAFHVHQPNRALIAVGHKLLGYDVGSPSEPSWSITLARASGNIVGIACSPYSKSLVAVATAGGAVSVINADKGKT